MTDKILIQFIALVGAFFAIWFSLSRIDFVNEEELRAFSKDNERRLGELVLETITATDEKIENEKISAILDSIKVRICRTKAVDCSHIKIHLVRNSEVNAFALPDNNMVIYSGLLEYSKNAEEVAGVMAHEIAHMEKNHVMKKLAKDIGLQMLFAIAGGEAGGDIARELAQQLSSSAFDRSQEREADEFAIESLAHANVDPQHLSNLFFRLSQTNKIPEELAWISTHPDTKERSAEIIKKKKEYTYETKPIINTSWEEVKKMVSDRGSENED